MPKPQRICGQEPCQAVALAGGRFCKRHATLRARARVERANAVRHERWLPENRSVDLDLRVTRTATDIITSVEAILRALHKNHIDIGRARAIFYGLQISYSLLRTSSPKDPQLRGASLALYDFSLTLAARRSS